MILVVDDHPDVCRAMQMLLCVAGWDARCVPDGATALAVISATPPQCVVLDDHMPDTTGLDVLRVMSAGLIRVPVIMFSSHTDPDRQDEAKRLGAVDWLPKTEVARLVARVAEVVGHRPN
ncbi:MAG: two component transcriptional regulator, LuxR family [Phycisphaerales bacterium]|nr:two component transcriptional regulator, LuxR family [Phycisphaerales bacterium]